MRPWEMGTRVRKRGSERGDAHPDGALATVLGVFSRGVRPEDTAYEVHWDGDLAGARDIVLAAQLEEVRHG